MIRTLMTIAALAVAGPAFANDTMAEVKTGGLVFTRTDAVTIESEDLFISSKTVRVNYVFRNITERDVESIVAFPMPDINFDQYREVALPQVGPDNFLGFSVNADGAEIMPELQQRAIVAGLDVTADILAAGLSANPHTNDGFKAVGDLPDRVKADWVSRGILQEFTYDDGSGWKTEYYPAWTLRSTYWWRMRFPAGQSLNVTHAYSPSVGGTTGLSFFYDGKFGGDHYPAVKEKYCIDSGFERAIAKTADQSGYAPFQERWISYVLTTGANWATSIGHFTLTIDKGDTRNLVSFCGSGVKKVGPTTFQLTYTDFVPQKDVDILLLYRFDQ